MYRLLFFAVFPLFLLIFGCSIKQQAVPVAHQGSQVNINDAEACLGCHADMKQHSHPVMVPYPPAGKEKEYVPAQEVRKAGIRIMDDQVSCVTCHDLSNPEPFHPIPGMPKSQLCLVCHLK